MNYSNAIKTLRIRPDGSGYTVAAGTSDLVSDAVDTQGFEGARFIIGFGALTSSAETSIKVTQCTTSGGTYADLTGTSITVADDDDNQIAIVEIDKPLERYLKLEILRGTANAVVDFCLVELFGPKVEPVTQSSAIVIAQEIHVSPAEGTA